MPDDTSSQCLEIVTAFQQAHDFTVAVLFRRRDERAGYVLKSFVADRTVGERVFPMPIKTGRNHQEFWTKQIDLRQNLSLYRIHVRPVIRSGIHRQIQCKSLAWPDAAFPVVPAAG